MRKRLAGLVLFALRISACQPGPESGDGFDVDSDDKADHISHATLEFAQPCPAANAGPGDEVPFCRGWDVCIDHACVPAFGELDAAGEAMGRDYLIWPVSSQNFYFQEWQGDGGDYYASVAYDGEPIGESITTEAEDTAVGKYVAWPATGAYAFKLTAFPDRSLRISVLNDVLLLDGYVAICDLPLTANAIRRAMSGDLTCIDDNRWPGSIFLEDDDSKAVRMITFRMEAASHTDK